LGARWPAQAALAAPATHVGVNGQLDNVNHKPLAAKALPDLVDLQAVVVFSGACRTNFAICRFFLLHRVASMLYQSTLVPDPDPSVPVGDCFPIGDH
jgi:hypothetical protein